MKSLLNCNDPCCSGFSVVVVHEATEVVGAPKPLGAKKNKTRYVAGVVTPQRPNFVDQLVGTLEDTESSPSRPVRCLWGEGSESRRLESRAKAAARLDLEVSAGRASLPYRGLWGGVALLPSPAPLETETQAFVSPPRKQAQDRSKIGY